MSKVLEYVHSTANSFHHSTIAGVLLVAFLSILRLTVATGMINSIILYANIV